MILTNQPFLWRSRASGQRACLCLHGLGGGIYELELLAQRLHQQGMTVRGINYPGHDHPGPRMPSSTWQQWYTAIEQAYLDLRQVYEQISLIGFSTGCPLGLHLAAHYPIERLALLSPFLRLRHRWFYLWRPEDYLYSSLGQWMVDVPRLRLPISDPDMRDQVKQIRVFRSFNLPTVRSALELIEQVKTEVSGIQCPILIIQSQQDSVVDPEGAQDYHRQLGSPHKQLLWLHHSDHLISLDREREQVSQAVCQFVAAERLG